MATETALPVTLPFATFPPRIAVAGTSGAGKSTVGRRLAAMGGVPYVELDALHWEPGWKHADGEVFRQRVRDALSAPGWVVDGNYAVVRDLTWGAADHVLWLDYALPRVLYQLTRRTFGRRFRNEELWNGNRERLRDHFFTGESLYVWVLKTHWKHRRTYPEWFARFPSLRVTRVRSPREMERHLDALSRLPRAAGEGL